MKESEDLKQSFYYQAASNQEYSAQLYPPILSTITLQGFVASIVIIARK